MEILGVLYHASNPLKKSVLYHVKSRPVTTAYVTTNFNRAICNFIVVYSTSILSFGWDSDSVGKLQRSLWHFLQKQAVELLFYLLNWKADLDILTLMFYPSPSCVFAFCLTKTFISNHEVIPYFLSQLLVLLGTIQLVPHTQFCVELQCLGKNIQLKYKIL